MPKGVYKRNPKMKIYDSKLSQKNDSKIRQLYLSGDTQKKIAEKYDCGVRCIRRSLRRTCTSTEGRSSMPGNRNPAWKGGRIQEKGGYILLHMPNNPMADSHGYVREHRFVISQLLGRPLKKEEVIHHKNKDVSDNRLENLLLFSSNGIHLGVELQGKKPQWTKEGLDRIASRSIPSMKGTCQTLRGTGVRTLRKRLISKYLHETSGLQHTGLEAKLELPSGYPRSKKKH